MEWQAKTRRSIPAEQVHVHNAEARGQVVGDVAQEGVAGCWIVLLGCQHDVDLGREEETPLPPEGHQLRVGRRQARVGVRLIAEHQDRGTFRRVSQHEVHVV